VTHRNLALVALGLACGLPPSAARAQGTCQFNNQSSCTVGGDAAHSITVTIVPAVRLSTPSTTVNLLAPDASSFNAGVGTGLAVPFQTRANTNWTVAVHSTATLWTNSGVGSRADKPRADLQWSTALGGSYTSMTGTPATFGSGSATATTTTNLFLRVVYSWALDTQGSYTLPLTITVTAP
jgi:hypothetical protein